MKFKLFLLIFFSISVVNSQSITLNEDFIYEDLRYLQLTGNFSSKESFTIRPISHAKYLNNYKEFFKTLYSSKNEKIQFKILPISSYFEFNSKIPYNYNNGSMLPNRGLQKLTSAGFYAKISNFSIQIKPEFLFRENLNYDGFWTGHYPEIWVKRYNLWNWIDLPESFGKSKSSSILIGQSNIKLDFKKISISLSNENIWWGPSTRNSIMMSNNARGFNHISINSNKIMNTMIGGFEWQFVTGKLIKSGYTPPQTDYEYGGNTLYIPKRSQTGNQNDWRYFQ